MGHPRVVENLVSPRFGPLLAQKLMLGLVVGIMDEFAQLQLMARWRLMRIVVAVAAAVAVVVERW